MVFLSLSWGLSLGLAATSLHLALPFYRRGGRYGHWTHAWLDCSFYWIGELKSGEQLLCILSVSAKCDFLL